MILLILSLACGLAGIILGVRLIRDGLRERRAHLAVWDPPGEAVAAWAEGLSARVPYEGQARPDVAPDWHRTPTGEYPYVTPSRYGRRRHPRAMPVCTRTVRDTGPAPAAMRWYETWRDAATATVPLTDPRWATMPLDLEVAR